MDAVLVRAAHANAYDIMFWTGVLFALVTFAVATASERVSPVALVRRNGSRGVIAGVPQGVTVVFFVLAVSKTSVANVMVLFASAPLIAGLLSWLPLRERSSRRVWTAVPVSVAGVPRRASRSARVSRRC